MQSNVDNGRFGVYQQSDGIIEPQTVDIGGEGGLQNIAKGSTDMTSADTKSLGNLFCGDGF